MNLDTHAERFILVSELAEYWRVSERTIYRDIEKGALIAVRVGGGGKLRIPIQAARAYGKRFEAPA
jgi:excisionase family DNA binding protein